MTQAFKAGDKPPISGLLGPVRILSEYAAFSGLLIRSLPVVRWKSAEAMDLRLVVRDQTMPYARARFLPPISVSGGPSNVNAAIIPPVVSNKAVKVAYGKSDLEIWRQPARFCVNATESQSGREIRHAAVPLPGGRGSHPPIRDRKCSDFQRISNFLTV